MRTKLKTLIIGAGPAGLTAGLELSRRGENPIILESTSSIGGISRTELVDGWRFDLGGHRFFTKNERVREFWHSILSEREFIATKRVSRIYFQGKFFDYPLKPLNALRNLGFTSTLRAIFSYVYVRLRPIRDQSNFETWVASRFGWYLYRTFFKTYTEKVWGIRADQIQSEWAVQRIKNLSLTSALLSAFFPKKFNKGGFTTLIDEFYYPIYGPGMMWEKCAQLISEAGGLVRFNEKIQSISRIRDRNEEDKLRVICQNSGDFNCDRIITSIALKDLISIIEPAPPEEVRKAASKLKYRAFITVAIPVTTAIAFPDNWIYIHSPDVKVGRVQNYGAWSPYLVKDGASCLGLEYFVEEGDDLWKKKDEEIVQLAIAELNSLKLIHSSNLTQGFVVRVPKAYPVYDTAYKECVYTIREYLLRDWPEIQTVGRNGLHRYNNQDHSMLTAMYAVDNLYDSEKKDVWSVNLEDEYHEESSSSRERLSPIYP